MRLHINKNSNYTPIKAISKPLPIAPNIPPATAPATAPVVDPIFEVDGDFLLFDWTLTSLFNL